MMDFTGKIFGSYKLLQVIGSGGYAVVYEAVHTWLRTHVAVKVLDIHVNSRNTQVVRRSLKEALITNYLKHPHIIPILDCNIQNGIPYIVMPYMKNGSLCQIYPEGVILPWNTIIDYVRQISEALTFVQAHNFIHQDVKPANMLMGDDGSIFLSDFGTVKFIQNTSMYSPQVLIGTVGYMAPERFTDSLQTPVSDVYSLGIVVYKWLTGRLPFTGSASEIVLKHLNVPPPTRPLHALGIDPAIQRVLLKALAKKPRNRYQSAIEFYEALREAKRETEQSYHISQRHRTSPNRRLLCWEEMSAIIAVSMFLSLFSAFAFYICGVQTRIDLAIWLIGLSIMLVLGGVVRKNWLALRFIFADFVLAILIGMHTQSLVMFCFTLSGLLLISAIIGFLKGLRV